MKILSVGVLLVASCALAGDTERFVPPDLAAITRTSCDANGPEYTQVTDHKTGRSWETVSYRATANASYGDNTRRQWRVTLGVFSSANVHDVARVRSQAVRACETWTDRTHRAIIAAMKEARQK